MGTDDAATFSFDARQNDGLTNALFDAFHRTAGLYLAYTRNTLERSFAALLDRIAQEIPKSAGVNLSTNLSQLETQIEEYNNQVMQSGAVSERVEAWLMGSKGQSLWHIGPLRPPHRTDSKVDDFKVQAKKPPPTLQLEQRSVAPLDDTDE